MKWEQRRLFEVHRGGRSGTGILDELQDDSVIAADDVDGRRTFGVARYLYPRWAQNEFRGGVFSACLFR